MSAMTRRLGASMVVGLLALSGVAACGGSDTPPSTRTTTVAPSTAETPSPTPESGLTGPTVVAVRELPDDSRVLVAYDLDDGKTRQLTTLQREDHPTVDATGTSVVVEQYTGTEDPRSWIQSGTASHLVLIDLTTGARRELTSQHSGVFDRQPSLNRSGDGWVYFLRSGPGVQTGALWRVDPGTGDVQQVPQGAVQEAPNGAGISQFVLEPGGESAWVQAGWCREAGQGCGGAFRLDLHTGAVTPHPFDPVMSGNLAWSNDGAWLAYSSNLGGAPGWPELTITPWPGGEPRTLLKMSEGAALFGQVGWHPDGRTIVLQTRSNALSEDSEPTPWQRILLVDTEDGSSTPIGPASVSDQSFDVWAPPATS
jgi:hypothetical protein